MIQIRLAAVILLVIFRGSAVANPRLDVVEAKCFNDGTLLARSSDFRLATLSNDHWQALPLPHDAFRLWRSPDGRIFATAPDGNSWLALQVPERGEPAGRWTIPTSSGANRFTSLDGVDVVTPDRIYRLDPGGRLTDLGETPVGASGRRLPGRAPEILVSPTATVVCTGTSHREYDDVTGSCREAHGAYTYRADFGEPLCCSGDEPSYAAPFVCGEVVISAVREWVPPSSRDRTQARALATGRLLGRRDGAARQGSACLDGKRALLVGKREIRIVTVPSLRTLWRQKTATVIGAVAVCGGSKAFVIPSQTPSPVQTFDLASSPAPRSSSP